jgi:cytochrome c-type biogenesis protein
LAFVAKASNPLLGGILLLFYTLGYSTPLLIVAASGGQALVELRNNNSYAKIGTWVTPITGGILLYSAVMGVLTTIIGDPSLAGLAFS